MLVRGPECALSLLPVPRQGLLQRRQVDPAGDLEGEYTALLRTLKPTRALFDLASAMFRDLWDARSRSVGDHTQALKAELAGMTPRTEPLMDRMIESENKALVAADETRLRGLEARKAELEDRITQCGTRLPDFDASFRTALSFLASPYELKISGSIEEQKMVLRLAFARQLPHVRDKGF